MSIPKPPPPPADVTRKAAPNLAPNDTTAATTAATTTPARGAGADLAELLASLDADAPLVQRHIWLIALLQWVRGTEHSAAVSAGRVDVLLDVLDARPQVAQRLRTWWLTLMGTVDDATLLSDYGLGLRNAFVSELIERLHRKLLPATPETTDAGELFSLVLPSRDDAQWIAALGPDTLARLARLLSLPTSAADNSAPPGMTHWQASLVEAITFCTGNIRAAGFAPDIRLRMLSTERAASPFHTLSNDFEALRDAWYAAQGTLDDAPEREQLALAVAAFKAKLEACRQAAASVYSHLDAHGISMDLVFSLRQLRERVLRVRALLDCLVGETPLTHTARLLANLAQAGQDQRSIGALLASNSTLLAAKVAQRSSETGEHYITRNRAEYRAMLRQAAGGGALTAGTTALKFAVMALGLSAFWSGFWAGAVYAASFVLIQLLHFTLATKQPAMTAPAMAAKLRDVSDPNAEASFVDEVTHLVRSQFAAVLGNVVLVVPVVIALSGVVQWISGSPLIDAKTADYVLHSLSLAGPSLLFAAFTGVLLFASSLIAGWVENWFVLHRLDSAIRYNPRIVRVLGAARADRWAHFMRQQVCGLAANISLGFMLGLVPAVLAFFSVGLEVRHVTLSAGQLAAACASLGLEVLHQPALYWAAASVPLIGVCNVVVSFYLAFRVALLAHNVTGLARVRLRGAIWRRFRQAPASFFWPTRAVETGLP